MSLLLLFNSRTISDYTRAVLSSLPTDDSPLDTNYSSQDVTDVSTDNAVRVLVSGSGYLVHQFKKKGVNNTTPIGINFNLQSSVDASTSPIYLQIYNRNTSSWETLDSNTTASADTDFNLTGTKSTSLSNYYSGTFEVSVRVYQQASGESAITFENLVAMGGSGNAVSRNTSLSPYNASADSTEVLTGSGYFKFIPNRLHINDNYYFNDPFGEFKINISPSYVTFYFNNEYQYDSGINYTPLDLTPFKFIRNGTTVSFVQGSTTIYTYTFGSTGNLEFRLKTGGEPEDVGYGVYDAYISQTL